MDSQEKWGTAGMLASRRNFLSLVAATAAARPAFAGPGQSTRICADTPWSVYYGSTALPDAFAPYGLAVLDPNYAHVAQVADRNATTVLGYISLGELNTSSPFAQFLRNRDMLVSENPNWPGSVSIDLRHPGWHQYILTEIVPRLIAGGFDGLFLDTLDSALHLETLNATRFDGMTAAAQALIGEIRRAYPDMPIMMNRAYALLPDINVHIDAILTESLVTTYDFVERRYKWVDDAAFAHHLELLRPAQRGARGLPVFSLDYWDHSDTDAIATIYARQRALGHNPYVATILLDELVPEPAHDR